jgi:hypothetical protein
MVSKLNNARSSNADNKPSSKKNDSKDRKTRLRKNSKKPDSDTDDTDVFEEEHDESDGWETNEDDDSSSYRPPPKKGRKAKRICLSDDDEDSDDSSYTPPAKKTKAKKRVVEESESESEDDENESESESEVESESEDDTCSSDSSDEEECDKKRFKSGSHKSKKQGSHTKTTKSSYDKKHKSRKPDTKKSKNAKNAKKTNKKSARANESESDESAEESSEYDDEDDEEFEYDEDENNRSGSFNIIFNTGGGFGDQYGLEETDENIEMVINDKNDVCDSDDEKTFMKETYKDFEVRPDEPKADGKDKKKSAKPEKTAKNSKSGASSKSRKDGSRSKKDAKDRADEESMDAAKLEEEVNVVQAKYLDLQETKKMFYEKLKRNPHNKIVKKALESCNKSIAKLVKKTRTKNTLRYLKMIKNENNQGEMEFDYFKKKLSHKEQVKITKELKEVNDHISIDKPYRLTLLESNLPIKYKATVMQKLNILRSMEAGDPEYYKIKNWIDTFMRVPFMKYKELSVRMSDGMDVCSTFMENAKQTLDNCVYGLNDAKMQIMQMVGQWISNPSAIGTSIAIHGPPGTGKSSIVKDGISKILGREFAFIALGGAGDASFLEGHSYTYEGSNWGKIIQILIDSKCMNPVIYFDELDKISETARGEEIANILTHLTDTTQNNQFHDKYFSEIDSSYSVITTKARSTPF